MAMISNLPISDFHVGLQLFEERPADFLPSLGLSLRVFDAFAPLKPISQATLTPGVSTGIPQQAKQTALTSYGAFLIQLPDISEDSSTAPPTVRARPAALPSIPGDMDMAAPQNVPTKAKGAPPAQESKPASRRPLPQPRDAQKPPANIPRTDAPAGRTGTHAAPAPPRIQTPQIVAPQMKNAPHGRVPQGRPGSPHAQAPHGYKHGDKPSAPATPHAQVPYAPGAYYPAKAPLKAHYGVCV